MTQFSQSFTAYGECKLTNSKGLGKRLEAVATSYCGSPNDNQTRRP